jgi:hypothetical protein
MTGAPITRDSRVSKKGSKANLMLSPAQTIFSPLTMGGHVTLDGQSQSYRSDACIRSSSKFNVLTDMPRLAVRWRAHESQKNQGRMREMLHWSQEPSLRQKPVLWPPICNSYSLKSPRRLRKAVRSLTSMLGWMLMFAAMSLWGAVDAAIGGLTGQVAGLTSSLVFGFLLIVSSLTFTLRGRA